MKPLRIISFVLLSLGALLIVTGSLFKIQHWPDMFHGLVTGPIVELLGLILLLVSIFGKKEQKI